jgi:hypothetical protein
MDKDISTCIYKVFPILIFLCIIIVSFGQSETGSEMPVGQFIDTGFRIKVIDNDAKDVFIIGETIEKMNIPNIVGMEDTIAFRIIRDFVFTNLVPSQLKFPNDEKIEIIRKYLLKRDSEEIINDGFYIGCGDICTVIGALLMKCGYDCKLIHAVSSKFTKTNDLGHVFLYIEKGERHYLYDPSMSNDIIEGYDPCSPRNIKIRSVIGDLFVFGVDQNPRKLGIFDIATLNMMRLKAYKYWQSMN